MTKIYEGFFKHLEKVSNEANLQPEEKMAIRSELEAFMLAGEAPVVLHIPQKPAPSSPVSAL